MARVFLSYTSADKPKVRLIAEALRDVGHEAWLDEEQILVGESITAALERGLREADFIVLCLSKATADRGWVEAERDATLRQQFRDRQPLILPVRLEPVDPPYVLAHLAYVDLFPDDDAFHRGLDRLSRSIDAYVARAPLSQPISAVSRAATLLFLPANPSVTSKLALDREVRQIGERLRSAEHRDAFRIEQTWGVRATDLQERLLRYRPSLVHFSGHGNPAGELLLEDETGQPMPVTTAALGNFFGALQGDIRCVVLDSCFSETQARAISDHVECVVGTTAAVDPRSASDFADAFYQALGYGEDVQTAFELACNLIQLTGLEDAALPRLLVRDGVRARDIRFTETGRAAARRRLTVLDERWKRLIDAGAAGGARFVEESRRFLDEFLRETIGFSVERELALRRGVVGFLVEAPMLWIRHTRFPILFLQQDDDPALVDRLAEFLQVGQLHGYFVVLVAVAAAGGTSDARVLRARLNGSPYRYDFVVLDREQLASLVSANEARRFVEMIVEQGTDPSSLSPYIVRGPVPENMFFGREREVKTLTQGIVARSFAVVAGRRMGKSSTLLRVQRALASDPRYEPVYLSCEDRPTSAAFLAMLGAEGDGVAAEDAALVRPCVAALRARADGRTIVFLLDEIDALLAYDTAHDGRLFRALRAAAHEDLCRFVFSGSRTLYEMLHEPRSPFFNFCEEVLLRPLDGKAVEAIVRKPMQQLGFELQSPELLVAEIARVTSSHPNLVQSVCRELVDGSRDRRVAAVEVERIAARRDIQREFVETIWSDTTPFERIVSLLSAGPTFSLAELQAEARRRGLPDEGRVAEALAMLELYSLVAYEGDRYQFAMEAYPAMVRRCNDVETLITSLARKALG
ncbi:TIR domain-containing protein [Sorangium sp. So ce388]|uniref:TIR domain-containing protein n=1 Tax=Sorangium sp. So ce388 TaxID=3133309 RepID=UPI003F5B6AEC